MASKTVKSCTKCKSEKPLYEFSSNPSCKFGVHSRCKKCMSISTRKWSRRRAKSASAITCGHCRSKKDSSEFYKGYSWCKECCRIGSKARRARNKSLLTESPPTQKPKTCSLCGICKHPSEFSSSYSARDGLQSRCRSCQLDYVRKKQSENRKRNARNPSVPENKKCGRCRIVKPGTQFHRNRTTKDGLNGFCKRCQLFVERLRKYGITKEQYEQLIAKQNGRCAICGEQETERSVLCIDHCHDNGHIRGLLCDNCNTAIGMMKNDPRRCVSAARYLELGSAVTA